MKRKIILQYAESMLTILLALLATFVLITDFGLTVKNTSYPAVASHVALIALGAPSLSKILIRFALKIYREYPLSKPQ